MQPLQWLAVGGVGLSPAVSWPASRWGSRWSRRPAAETVSTLEIDGVISPVTVRLVSTAIERARADGAAALVILLDTPGGLERSMRSIVRDMLNSPVPVIVYVAPTGARAASAGAFITIAAHVAAMAPATNIGAAHPVAAGGGSMDKEMMREGGERRGRLHPVRGARARAEPGLGREGGALERVGHRAGGAQARDHRPGRREPPRPPGEGRRPAGEDVPGRGHPPHAGGDRPGHRHRVARPVPRAHHRPEHRLHPPHARHAGPLLRAREPRASSCRA